MEEFKILDEWVKGLESGKWCSGYTATLILGNDSDKKSLGKLKVKEVRLEMDLQILVYHCSQLRTYPTSNKSYHLYSYPVHFPASTKVKMKVIFTSTLSTSFPTPPIKQNQKHIFHLLYKAMSSSYY